MSKTTRLLYFLAAFAAGAMLTLSFAPYSIWWMGLLSISIFASLITTKNGFKISTGLAFLFGLGLYGTGVSWVYVSIHEHGQVPVWLAVIFTAGFVAFLSLIHTLPWMLMGLIAKNWLWRLACFPSIWLLDEWLRGWLLTGFPWLYAGYGQLQSPLSGWIPILGALGSSWVICLMAVALLWLLRSLYPVGFKQDWNSASVYAAPIIALALVFAIATVGIKGAEIQWTQPMLDESQQPMQIPVALVQPNIALEDKWDPNEEFNILSQLERLSSAHWQEGMLVWPEAALPAYGYRALPYIDKLDQLAEARDTAFFTGVLLYHDQAARLQNTLIGRGLAAGDYRKQRLVPFGEYVPLERWLRGTMRFFDLPMSRSIPGAANQTPLSFVYTGQSFGVAPAICYEVAYGELARQLARDAHMLMTVSNDGWFGTSIGPWQHLEIAQARALEHQKPIVRATNNGVTAAIDAKGDILDSAPQFAATVVQSQIEPRSGQTPYARWGVVPILVMAMMLLAGAIVLSRLRSTDNSNPLIED